MMVFCKVCRKEIPSEADLFKHNLTWEHRSRVESSAVIKDDGSDSSTRIDSENSKKASKMYGSNRYSVFPAVSGPDTTTSDHVPTPPPARPHIPQCGSRFITPLMGPIPLFGPPHPYRGVFSGWPPPPPPHQYPYRPTWSDEVRYPLRLPYHPYRQMEPPFLRHSPDLPICSSAEGGTAKGSTDSVKPASNTRKFVEFPVPESKNTVSFVPRTSNSEAEQSVQFSEWKMQSSKWRIPKADKTQAPRAQLRDSLTSSSATPSPSITWDTTESDDSVSEASDNSVCQPPSTAAAVKQDLSMSSADDTNKKKGKFTHTMPSVSQQGSLNVHAMPGAKDQVSGSSPQVKHRPSAGVEGTHSCSGVDPQKRSVSAGGKVKKANNTKGQKRLVSVTLAEGKVEKTTDPKGQKKSLSETLAKGKAEKTNDPNCTGNPSFVKVNQQSHKKLTGETSIRKPNFPPKERKSKASVSANLASKGAQIGKGKYPQKAANTCSGNKQHSAKPSKQGEGKCKAGKISPGKLAGRRASPVYKSVKVIIRDISPKLIPPEKPKKASHSRKSKPIESLESPPPLEVQPQVEAADHDSSSLRVPSRKRRLSSGSDSEPDPVLKLPPCELGGAALLFGDVAEIERADGVSELKACIAPKGEVPGLKECVKRSQTASAKAATGMVSQRVSSTAAVSAESTTESPSHETGRSGPSAVDNPVGHPTAREQMHAENINNAVELPPTLNHTSATPTATGSSQVHGKVASKSYGHVQSMLNETLTSPLTNSVAHVVGTGSPIRPLISPDKVQDTQKSAGSSLPNPVVSRLCKDSVSSTAGNTDAGKITYRLQLPLISPDAISQLYSANITHPAPLKPLALPSPLESGAGSALPLSAQNPAGSSSLSPSTSESLQLLQKKLEFETTKLKLIELQALDSCDGATDSSSVRVAPDTATQPVCASTRSSQKIPVNRCTQQTTTSTPASQPACKTSSNKDTSLKSHSVASPVSLKSSIQHVGVKNVTSPKLESIIRTLKSKKTPSYSSPNPCTENSDSLFDRGTCASSGSDAGKGDIPKRKKRKKSIEVGGKKKQRLDKTEKMSEQPTPSPMAVTEGGGMGGVSDPESMSVSSSQHSISQEESGGDLMTPHMKFASDIAALDKRDKELQEKLFEAQNQVMTTVQCVQESEQHLLELQQQQRQLAEQRMELTDEYKKILVKKQNLFSSPSKNQDTQDVAKVDLNFLAKMKTLSEKEQDMQLRLLQGNQVLEKVSMQKSQEENKLEKMKSDTLKCAQNQLAMLMGDYKEIQRQKQELLTTWNPPTSSSEHGLVLPQQSTQPLVANTLAPDSSRCSSPVTSAVSDLASVNASEDSRSQAVDDLGQSSTAQGMNSESMASDTAVASNDLNTSTHNLQPQEPVHSVATNQDPGDVSSSRKPLESIVVETTCKSNLPLDHAAYTCTLSPHSQVRTSGGLPVSEISESPLNMSPPRTIFGPPRCMLTPLSQHGQPESKHVAVSEAICASTPPPLSALHSTLNTANASEEVSAKDSVETEHSHNSHLHVLEPNLQPISLVPLLPSVEACNSPATATAAVSDSAAVADDDQSGIRQAWRAALALSSAACSNTPPLSPGACDDTTDSFIDLSSQDEKTVDERDGSEAGVFEYSPCHENSVLGIKISENHLYTCSSDKSVRVYDVKSCQEVRRVCNHKRSVTCIEIFTYGKESYIVSGSSDKHVVICNAKTGEIEIDFDLGSRVICMLSRDNLLVAGLSNGYVHVINVQRKCALGKSLVSGVATSSGRDISCLCLHDNLLFTACYDNTVSCWDVSEYTASHPPSNPHIRKIHQIICFEKFVLCMQVGGELLYCGSADTTLQIFSIKTWQPHGRVKGHGGAVSGMCLSGNILVTSCFDRYIRCYDTKNMMLLQVYGIPNLPFTLCSAGDTVYCGLKDGKVMSIRIDLSHYHQCQWAECGLKFGLKDHLRKHLREHFSSAGVWPVQCKWGSCNHSVTHDSEIYQHINSYHFASNRIPV